MELGGRRLALKAFLEAKPGATADSPGGRAPSALLFKVRGKMFAILSLAKAEFVILKCDPHLAETLREQYRGLGHRSHLDPRFWIAVDLDADVPEDEVRRLVDHSYDLVRAGLTKKQRAELEAGR